MPFSFTYLACSNRSSVRRGRGVRARTWGTWHERRYGNHSQAKLSVICRGRGGDGPMVRVLTFYSVDLSSILLSLQFYSVKLRQFMMDNNQICCNNWVDAYKPAPPSTKELRGLQLTSRNSNCTQTHSFIL